MLTNEIKTLQVFSHYEYPPNDFSVKSRRWVPLDKAVNKALEELEDAEFINIQFQVSVSQNVDDMYESALIIYRKK